MKNFKKISICMLMSMLVISGSMNGALPTRAEKMRDGLTVATVAPTVFGGAAYMFKKHMDSMSIAQLSETFGEKTFVLKAASALALTASIIAGVKGLQGIKQSITRGNGLNPKQRCAKMYNNAKLLAVSSLVAYLGYKGLAMSAYDIIYSAVDRAYNVKAFTNIIAGGMIATGAYLGYRGLKEAWEGIRNKGCVHSPMLRIAAESRAEHPQQ